MDCIQTVDSDLEEEEVNLVLDQSLHHMEMELVGHRFSLSARLSSAGFGRAGLGSEIKFLKHEAYRMDERLV